jgi:hypothetical protein
VIREKRGGLFVALATALAMCVGPYACSSSGALSGLGGPCSQFSDCQQDLICGKGPDGTRVCTNDPSGLQPPQGKDAGGKNPMMPGGDASSAGDANDDLSTPVGDAEPPEVGSPGPDAGKPVDSGKLEDTGKLEDSGMTQEAAPVPEAGGTDGPTD